MEEDNPIFYLYLQKRLLDNSDSNKIIKQADANIRIKTMRIPKRLIPLLLKDMEKLNLGKRINKFEFGIVNYNKCNKIKRLLGK